MKIIFVTGKGGVGKSTVAAAYALQLAKTGKNTLLVELGDQSFYADYFDIPVIGYKPLQLQENLDVSLWTGQECLREYALHLIKIESLFKLFFENQVTKALINIAPALPELSILGKITSGPRQIGPKMNYEYLVVDAYASGHFLALLRAPVGMLEAIAFGPMGEQSRNILKVISDASICQYVVVSKPEELPVTEAIELSQKIEKAVGIKPLHLMNQCLPNVSAELKNSNPSLSLPVEFVQHIQKVLLKQNQLQQKMQEHGNKCQLLPWIFQHQSWAIVHELAKELTRELKC